MALNTRIKLKYDTFSNWTLNNPVLLKGELAIAEIPTEAGSGLQEPAFMLKVGDGVKNFSDLDWISGKAADVYSWAKTATKPEYQANEIKGLEDFISGEIQDSNTKYQIVKTTDLSFKLQYKEINGDWTDQDTIELVAPTYNLVEGETNGTVKFGITGSEVEVPVHGLGSAAYTETSAYDTAGSAEAVKTELIGEGSGTSTTIKGVYDEAKGYTDTQIAAKISSTYKAAGSITFESLPELSAIEEGKVYNISNEFTTTENFVEGAGKKYPIGTNVVCIDIGTDEYKWDVLAGVVDLSAYDTAEIAQGKIDSAKQAAIEAAAQDATQKANTAEQNAKDYADGLNTTLTEKVTQIEEKVGETAVSEQITTEINKLQNSDASVANQFVTAVKQENGIVTVERAQPTIADITELQTKLDEKANTADLATVATTGKIEDLTQESTITFDCGDSIIS